MFTIGDVMAGQATHAQWLARVERDVQRTRYLDSLPPAVALEVIERDYLESRGERKQAEEIAGRLREVRSAR